MASFHLGGTKEERKRPSEVFATRLRETRRARDLSQAELARRMTEVGRPMSKAALLRIENGERGLSLDEAIALTRILHAVPAQILTAPDGTLTALTGHESVDGGGMRNWLMYGEPVLAFSIAIDLEGTEPRAVLRGRLESDITHHALALADAARANDKAGITAAGEAIVRAVHTYQEATEQRGQGDA
jgi:transcriptional regulator with XRE-family HTH domain